MQILLINIAYHCLSKSSTPHRNEKDTLFKWQIISVISDKYGFWNEIKHLWSLDLYKCKKRTDSDLTQVTPSFMNNHTVSSLYAWTTKQPQCVQFVLMTKTPIVCFMHTFWAVKAPFIVYNNIMASFVNFVFCLPL